ncbi:phytochrome-like protein cph2 [mine drainage metagenome]|uniref:Phytochrome-like protein cph2 n=1 Tax=mine drainage metagenome TaxID=410659 RepID=A0A1J5QFF5_9ZZZZ
MTPLVPGSRRRSALVAAWPRMLGRRLGVAALLFLGFVAPVVVTLVLTHLGEQGIRVERDLQSVVTELHVQDGWEWRVISGRENARAGQGPINASRTRLDALLARATDEGLPADAAERVRAAIHTYQVAVDQELRLLAVGKWDAAATFDASDVVPAFEEAQTVLAAEGSLVAVHTARALQYSNAGPAVMLLAIVTVSVVQGRRRRISVQHEAEQAGEVRYRTLIDQSSDLVLVTDRNGRCVFLSPSAERFLSTPEGVGAGESPQAVPFDLLSVVDPQDRARVAARLHAVTPERGADLELRLIGGHGTRRFAASVQDLEANPSVGGLVLTARDVTDKLLMLGELEHRALHDPLTGLPNRTLLTDRMDQALIADHGVGTALVLLDLDRFREINDTFGHHHGDEVLRQVGPRLAQVVGPDATVSRITGDEFAVLLPRTTDLTAAISAAAALRATLEIPFLVDGAVLDLEASAGVVISGLHGTDASTLLQRADIAMYVAKTDARGVFVYDPELDARIPSKVSLLGDLRRALEHDELVLHYQPKVSVRTGAVVGVEALVRWEHPIRGMVAPDDFIPLAEHTGLIGPLTRRVLDLALTQARIWSDAGRPLVVSVNLSARNLVDDVLIGQVVGLLAEHGVRPELLELEVTETAIMTEPGTARQLLEALSRLGIRISIDDFGVGYTSIGQITSLPVDELKIDRSFVTTMDVDPDDELIVRSIVELGHNLDLTIVAEGVETEEVLTALSAVGCDVAQGYYLSRPLPVAAMDAWLDAHVANPIWIHEPPPLRVVPRPRRYGDRQEARRPD